MTKQSFWAKKPYRDTATPTVADHCRDVCRTAESVFHAVAPDLATTLGVDVSAVGSLLPLLRAAALLHDFAKVNSAFQDMLSAKPGDTRRQPVRHEILAAWLLADPDFFQPWFGALRHEEEIWPVIWAVAGHHLKMGDPARGASLFHTGSEVRSVSIPLSLDDVRGLLRDAAAALGVAIEPAKIGDRRFDTVDDEDDALEQRINRFAEKSCQQWNRLKRKTDVIRRTALLKAFLIAADVAASALTADGQEPGQWVSKSLSARITRDVLAPIVNNGTKGNEPFGFQKEVANSENSATIVIAGCGNGKTTAAYLWAQRYAIGRKLWFTYPTTGTASAGYQGYLYEHAGLLSDLIHGRAQVDLHAIRGTFEDDRNDEAVRLESLRAWDRQAVVCTVDTVLGLIQNQRRPLFSFPVIAAGAFVFDEIHSYDARLFGALLRFLQVFSGAPVLLMSASIPPGRISALREVLGGRAGAVIRGDAALEGYKRYRLESRDSAASCQEAVAKALREGKKVLWVCNTVASAIKQAHDAYGWAGVDHENIIVYHSRFRYLDRVARQKQVIAEFEYYTKGEQIGQRVRAGPRLIIATQVCEMSLDISADLMVTAECPLPALGQRLGRLNRYAAADDPWPCLVYPFQGNPYADDAQIIGMAAARDVIRELAGSPCSQHDLAQRLNRMADAGEFDIYSAWLDDGWLSEPVQIRDADSGITLIREEDLAQIEHELGPEYRRPSKWTFRSLVPWTIPMLHQRGFHPERRAGGYPVAMAGTVAYCEKEGAEWQTQTK